MPFRRLSDSPDSSAHGAIQHFLWCDRFGDMIHLFSYGTLQQNGVQMSSFGRLLKGAPDALPGWKSEMVEITDPDVLAKSGERFHPIVMPSRNPADEVGGRVFRITPEELAAADAMK